MSAVTKPMPNYTSAMYFQIICMKCGMMMETFWNDGEPFYRHDDRAYVGNCPNKGKRYRPVTATLEELP